MHLEIFIFKCDLVSSKQPLSMFFVDLKPAPNNKDIFNAEFLQQCKIKFEPPKHKRDIAQCANCQRYGHTKNYCHLKQRCMKCASDHLTNQCHREERSSDVRCVLCGGNHPANYKGCTVYKDLQKKKYQPLRLKQYTTLAQIKQTLHTQLGITYAQITKQNTYAITTIEQDQHINQPLQHTSDIQELKNTMKSLFEQLGTMLNLLTTVIAKLN
jgi:hypothetical protein